ncbi:MAG: hypothetical protein R3B09_07375 [Nannocystaceae bacterium]
MDAWDGILDLVGWAALALTPALLIVATMRMARERGDRRGMGAAGNALQEVGAILQPDRPSLLTMAEAERSDEDEDDGGPPR